MPSCDTFLLSYVTSEDVLVKRAGKPSLHVATVAVSVAACSIATVSGVPVLQADKASMAANTAYGPVYRKV
ncbi:hypothetical protein [Pontibacter anaerobius]|uniref:Uncharacterized protein n=1 Tax=Pontibacter anaerobius TaxID=2993940 RepID=A0ABT3RI25_9BACT|nr:hypothetical protein [Pontibacter anaerobius]MCX2741022.1 hypothetical protein [Pontibacter anaerobius]